MQLNVSGHHVDVTDSLHQYISSKFDRLERHFDHMPSVKVILSIEKLRQKAEATFHLSGTSVHAESEDTDMYAAIDSLTDKLDRQIKKHKEKITDHHKQAGRQQKQVDGATEEE